jgi:nitroreductase
MDVYDAVATRRAVRRFLGKEVPRQALTRVLAAAAHAPSGGNLQPWHSFVVSGSALSALKATVATRLAAGDEGDEREFEMYPRHLQSPYKERQVRAAQQRYSAHGIAREDTDARRRFVARNWDCFGAPCALFCYIDAQMGAAQWADVGMYLQTVMLLLRAEGLHSCPQMAWSVYRTSVTEVVKPADGLLLYCGLSIGFEDPRAKLVAVERAPLDETVAFVA